MVAARCRPPEPTTSSSGRDCLADSPAFGPGREGPLRLFIDFETRSACDLKKHGAHVYSEHPTTDILCMALKWENKSPFVITPRTTTGAALADLLEIATEIWAHNASFEQVMWENVAVPRYGWPPLPLEKLRCSAAKAAMHSLPRRLEDACNALGLPVRKDMEGYKVMMKMCKPRRARKGEPEYNPNDPFGNYWNDDPALHARLQQYCMADVVAEEALSNALRDLPDAELRIWQLDQIINNRGILADLEACRAMLEMVGEHEGKLLKRLGELTNGAVRTAKQVEALRGYLRGLGVDLPDLGAATVKEALKTEGLNETARELLEIRRSLGRSSSAKYQAILDRASDDGRVRGTLLYHGAGTGRWSGSGIQPQNFPSRIKTSAGPEEILEAIMAGGLDLHDMLYADDPMSSAGAITRSVLVAGPGHDLIVADLSAIEGRMLAWLAGEESELEIYRQEKDPYIAAASLILHKPYDQITKEERQSPGKISVLACVAEGSLVLTDKGLVPIEEVTLFQKVWDGEGFVSHKGAVYQGVKEVMSYGGLQATPDHVVFTEEGEEIELREAAGRQQRLAQTGPGGTPIRLGEDYLTRHANKKRVSADSLPVSGLWCGEVDRHEQPPLREDGRVPEMQSAKNHSDLVAEENVGREVEMPETDRSPVQELRGEGGRVPIRDRDGSWPLGDRASGNGERERDRQNKQRRPLRAGKPPLGYQEPEREQYPAIRTGVSDVSQIQGDTPGDQIRGQHPSQSRQQGIDLRADHPEVLRSKLQTKRPVWDILEAGPRNRFTVSGVLVHNCGYQGSVGAVRKFGGEGLTDDEIKEQIVNPWRDAHPMTVQFWWDLERACFDAVKEPGKIFAARGIHFRVKERFLLCRLPSGRLLYYYDPKIQPVMTAWEELKDQVTYMTVNGITRKWGRTNTYGGKLAENATQAAARDILANGMIEAEAAGYPVVLSVHDEIISEVPEGSGSVEEFEGLMCIVPAWANGLPLKAKGFRAKRYRK